MELSAEHARLLDAHAINPETLASWGAYTAMRHADLPERIDCPTPALIFPLLRLDGRTVWQARPDTPKRRVRPDGRTRSIKYVSQWGETGVIFNATHDDTWRSADTILLTEGTKQSYAAARYAPHDVAVIGILGCSNWTTDGNPARDLVTLMRETRARRIVVAFDADIRSNINVWTAARRLDSTLQDLNRTIRPDRPVDVLFSVVQNRKGTRKADIDGVLGTLTDEERHREIQRIVTEAGDLSPWGGQLDLPVSVRPDLGLTLTRVEDTPDPDTPPDTLPANTLMNAALTVDTAWTWLPDPARPDRPLPDTRLDIRMDAWRPGRPPAGVIIPAQTWTDIQDLGSLTLKGGGPAGLEVSPPAGAKGRAMILDALRRTSGQARVVRLTPRTGWQEHPDTGRMVWVCAQGAIGADGWDHDLQARTNEVIGRIRFTEHVDDTTVGLQTAILTGLLRRLLAATVRADACLGAFALGLLPIPPKCAIALFGEFSKGKSTLMQIYSSLLSPDWTPYESTSEFNFYATENAIGNSMDGVNGMPVFYDDMKKPTSRAERQRLNDVFDAIVRRSHGSQAKMRSTVRDGRVVIADRDGSQPLAFIVGERVPSDAAASALSRIFQVPMSSGYSFAGGELNRLVDGEYAESLLLDRFTRDYMTFRPDGPDRFDDEGNRVLEAVYRLTSSDAWRAVVPGFVQWLAARMDGEDMPRLLESRRRDWQSRVAEHPRWVAARRDGVRLSTREAIVVAGLMTGLETWLEWARPLVDRVLDAGLAEPVDMLADGLDGILDELVATHLLAASNAAGDDTSQEGVLDRLRAAVASNRVRVKGLGVAMERDYRPVIGVLTRVRGVGECVAVDPKTVVGEVRLFDSMTDQDVAHALAGVAVRDARGSVLRVVRIGGAPTRCVCVPRTVWDEGLDPLDDDGSMLD